MATIVRTYIFSTFKIFRTYNSNNFGVIFFTGNKSTRFVSIKNIFCYNNVMFNLGCPLHASSPNCSSSISNPFPSFPPGHLFPPGHPPPSPRPLPSNISARVRATQADPGSTRSRARAHARERQKLIRRKK